MAYLGLGLQIAGIALILTGGFRAAQEMGAVNRWWAGVSEWVGDGARRFGSWVVRVVLHRNKPVVIQAKAAVVTASAGKGTVTVGEPDWGAMDHDEQLAAIRKRLDAVRDLVDRNSELVGGRLDGMDKRVAEFESIVDERFGGHDARDQTILGYELAGGAISLLGTVLVLIA